MVRNYADLGTSLQKIFNRLMANQNLLKLLYYTDNDPLSHDDLTDEQIHEEVYEKLIKITPRLNDITEANSALILRVAGSHQNPLNDEFNEIELGIEVFVPLTQWIIKDTNLRPFAIMGEIHKSLFRKKIDGIGTIMGGDFELSFLTEEISDYSMIYNITNYD